MFGRAIQGTPCEQRAWLSPWGSAKTAGCIHFWCCRMDLSTFSTVFSTEFVKKRGSFPRCFPLFPPSFPQKIELWVIHDVFQNGKRGKIWREKGSKSLFLKRKSRSKIYFLRRFALGAKEPLPSGIFDIRVFHKRCPAKTMCGKPWENPSFPQTLQGEKKSAPGAGRPAEALECWKIYTAP